MKKLLTTTSFMTFLHLTFVFTLFNYVYTSIKEGNTSFDLLLFEALLYILFASIFFTFSTTKYLKYKNLPLELALIMAEIVFVGVAIYTCFWLTSIVSLTKYTYLLVLPISINFTLFFVMIFDHYNTLHLKFSEQVTRDINYIKDITSNSCDATANLQKKLYEVKNVMEALMKKDLHDENVRKELIELSVTIENSIVDFSDTISKKKE